MGERAYAALSAQGTADIILVALIACGVLLAIRAWGGVIGVTLTRRVSYLLDGAIGLLFVLFLVFVVLRFKTVA